MLLSSVTISKPLVQYSGSLSDPIIISGNLLTGEGAAGTVGGGQEIWDSLYGVVNYHGAPTCNYAI